MFSSRNYLKRKTPCPGINRQEFIQHLVDEYYTTNNLEAQEQVTANLANFAYDPINWEYLKNAEVLKLFLELLETPNDILRLHGTAGLCNICLDQQSSEFIKNPENIKTIQHLLLHSENKEVILNCCTIIYQLLSNGPKSNILTGPILKRIQYLCSHYKSDKRIYNITVLLLEDFGKRYEFFEDPPK